jgi:twitching motility protein PilT
MIILNKIIALLNSGIVFTDVYARSHDALMIRTPAGWVSATDAPLTAQDVEVFIEPIAGEGWKTRLEDAGGALDVAKTLNGVVRLRCNLFTCGGNEDQKEYAVSIRKLPVVPPAVSAIGLPETLIRTISRSKGLWLITGPTGNGKSTTIASILEHINQHESKHILTIEQPVEYVMTPKKSIITQRDVGVHTSSFNSGLFAALRQRPDIIMIGEVRDRETLETMMQAAESGHLVFSTLHTKNVEDAIIKIGGYFPENKDQKMMSLSMTLAGVISQVLVPSIDKKSLVLAYEVFVNSPEGQSVIRKDEIQKLRNVIQSTKSIGSCLMNDTLETLVKSKKISVDTALDVSYDKDSLRNRVW